MHTCSKTHSVWFAYDASKIEIRILLVALLWDEKSRFQIAQPFASSLLLLKILWAFFLGNQRVRLTESWQFSLYWEKSQASKKRVNAHLKKSYFLKYSLYSSHSLSPNHLPISHVYSTFRSRLVISYFTFCGNLLLSLFFTSFSNQKSNLCIEFESKFSLKAPGNAPMHPVCLHLDIALTWRVDTGGSHSADILRG